MIDPAICKHSMSRKNRDGSYTCLFCGISVFVLNNKQMDRFIEKLRFVPVIQRAKILTNIQVISLGKVGDSWLISISPEMTPEQVKDIRKMWGE
jgi:hypothetical protein